MAKIIVGIISYLGSSKNIQQERLSVHNEQLTWFSNYFNKDNIFIASQYYNKEWYKPKLATYWDSTFDDSKLKPGAARNFLLKKFYNTDADWFILADNDSILDPRSEDDIIHYIKQADQTSLNSFPHCFVPVCPNVPGQGAWKDYFKTNKNNIKNNWIFEKGKIKTSFTFLKNLKKHHKFELYFDDGKIYDSGEDWAFGIELIKNGYRSMWCRNIILKEMGGIKNSGTWKSKDDKRGHADFQPLLRKKLAEQYRDDGICDINNELSMVKFYKKYEQTNKNISLPKACNNLFTIQSNKN